MAPSRSDFLKKKVKHIDVTSFDAVPLIEAMQDMSFQARNLARASIIFNQMVKENSCINFLTLAGSLISAGLKKTILTLIETNMIDCIVSTGANIVDMDFFEALGFSHFIGDPKQDDTVLHNLGIDRIYDTYISEYDLRVCDAAVTHAAETINPEPGSSRIFTTALGSYLVENDLGKDSILRKCFEKNVPIFIPSLSDCSAGFGLVVHQNLYPDSHYSHDSVKDFSELGKIVTKSKTTGLLMLGGGVPKNFIQDTVVLADILGTPVSMHKYAIQITVADERDGALSGSTLKEAHSWGKVEQGAEQMVFSEATIALPLLTNYAFKKNEWTQRTEKKLNVLFPLVKKYERIESSKSEAVLTAANLERSKAINTVA